MAGLFILLQSFGACDEYNENINRVFLKITFVNLDWRIIQTRLNRFFEIFMVVL